MQLLDPAEILRTVGLDEGGNFSCYNLEAHYILKYSNLGWEKKKRMWNI